MWRKGWISEEGDQVGASKATGAPPPTTHSILTPLGKLSATPAACSTAGAGSATGCDLMAPRLATRCCASRQRGLTPTRVCVCLCHSCKPCASSATACIAASTKARPRPSTGSRATTAPTGSTCSARRTMPRCAHGPVLVTAHHLTHISSAGRPDRPALCVLQLSRDPGAAAAAAA
jgi:hypothetical protein